MGSKKGLQKYKNIWSAKNNVTWTTKRSEKKVSRDSSWHVPEKNNCYFYFLFEKIEKTISSRTLQNLQKISQFLR